MTDARTNRTAMSLVQPFDSLPTYAPPGHSGVRNWRLVEAAQNLGFEMVLGEAQPGGAASLHIHTRETQIMVILEGSMELTIDDDEPIVVLAPSIVTIPPLIKHGLRNLGPGRLRAIVIYTPPLP